MAKEMEPSDLEEKIRAQGKKILAAANRTPSPTAKPVSGPTPNDEIQSLEIDKLKIELEDIRGEMDRGGHIHWARLIGLSLLFILVVVWLSVILNLVYWSGVPTGPGTTALMLPQPVVIALIGSTTLNVLGLFGVAAKWLYSDGKPSRKG